VTRARSASLYQTWGMNAVAAINLDVRRNLLGGGGRLVGLKKEKNGGKKQHFASSPKHRNT